MRIGYKRVSTSDQNTDRQLVDLQLDRIIEDIASGKSTDRPQLQALLGFAREGDVVYVHSLDRLARNLMDLKTIINHFRNNKVEVFFVKENLVFNQTTNPFSELMLNLLGAFAEFERSIILERQREGIKIAKEKGKYTGRHKALSADQERDVVELLKLNYSIASIATRYKLSRNTIYKYIKRTNPELIKKKLK